MAIVLKTRTTANEELLHVLHSRITLTNVDAQRFSNLFKGIAGEQQFEKLTASLQSDFYLLHDICLEHNHSIFQIDTLLISEQEIIIFEVKNYEGEYVYESESFRMLSTNQEILNPLHQLNRSKTLLQSLMKKMKVHIPIKGYLIFINPEFTLLQAPVDMPIILPSQLKRFLRQLNQTPSSLTKQHEQLAEHLVNIHLPTSPYERETFYSYNQLQKGIRCPECGKFMSRKNIRTLACVVCGLEEALDAGIIRSVNELKLLFPEMKISSSIVWEWCAIVDSQKTIRRVLVQNFVYEGGKKHRYYTDRLSLLEVEN